jgi:hypothetical protein
MAEIKISNTDTYQGVYPTVFKKINSSDVSLTPFQSYKQWTFYSGSSTSSCLPLQGVYTNPDILPNLGTSLTYNDAANVDSSLQSITYYSINHLFYKYKSQPYNTYGPTNLNRITKQLYQTASIFSIPYLKVGEGIKPASFSMTSSYLSGSGAVYGTGSYGTGSYGIVTQLPTYIQSDRYGNIYDASFNTSSIISQVKFVEGFDEYFDTSRITYVSENVTYVTGVSTNTGVKLPIGLAAKFSGSAYIKTDLAGDYDRDHDYAISFFISASNPTSANELIITKAYDSNTTQYPFRIELSGSNQLVFSTAGSNTFKTQVTSSSTVTSWTHVLCQKTGSSLQMYVNGTLHSSVSSNLLINTFSPLSASARIDNPYGLLIGGFDSTTSNLYGVLDEIRIYNKALSATLVGYLSDRSEGGTMFQSNIIGNVFSKQGLVVISTPDYRFNDILQTAYTASYRSTLTSYELGVVTKIDSGDFNLSLNQSLTADDDITYHSFITGSTFTPYITTIGLYDDMGQLLAVGKLAQPIKKPANVDLNFLVRMDLNNNIIPR